MPVRKTVKPAEDCSCGCKESNCSCGKDCCSGGCKTETTASPKGTKVLSLASFIASFIEPVAAVVLGHVALNEYKKKNLTPEWKNFAIAGTVLGYVGILARIFLVTTLLSIFSLALFGTHHYYPEYPIYYSNPAPTVEPMPMYGYDSSFSINMPMDGMNR